jgi:hypothetical protein
MRTIRIIAATVVSLTAWLLLSPLDAEVAKYGHCRDEQHEFAGHSFKSGPTGTVCRTCEGSDGGGCHISFASFYSCGPDLPAGHDTCPSEP